MMLRDSEYLYVCISYIFTLLAFFLSWGLLFVLHEESSGYEGWMKGRMG